MRSTLHQTLGTHALFNQGCGILGLAFKPPYVREDVIQVEYDQRAVGQPGPRWHLLHLVAVAMQPSGGRNPINMFSAHGVTLGD